MKTEKMMFLSSLKLVPRLFMESSLSIASMKDLLKVFMLHTTMDGKKTSSSGTVGDSKL